MSIENQKPQENESKNIDQSPEIETKSVDPETAKPEEAVQEKTPETKKEEKPENKKEEQPEESKAEDHEAKVDLVELKKQLEEANEKGKQVETLTNAVESLKAENKQQQTTIQEYEELLTNLVQAKIKQIPDQFQDLVPDNMTLKQQLSWLEKAEAKGLFNREEKQNPAVEVGKPMNVDVPKVDTTKMSASELLRMAYSTVKK